MKTVRINIAGPGADPGFLLGGGALVSCSTSTPINHVVFFFCRMPVVLENRRLCRGGGGGWVRTPCTLPLDPPLWSLDTLMKVLLFMVHMFLFLLLKKLYCDCNIFNIKCAI